MNLSDQDKIKILKADLAPLKKHNNSQVSLESLTSFLDDRVHFIIQANSQFDRDILEQLIERIPKNYTGDFDLEDFIKVWLEADHSLEQKIIHLQQQDADYQPQRDIILKKLNKAKKDQKTNQHGIMEVKNVSQGSILTIKLVKGQGMWGNQDLSVDIHFGEEMVESKFKKGPMPVWDEQFSFQVNTGQETIHLIVKNTTGSPVGQTQIPISLFQDQQTHQENQTLDGNKVTIQFQGYVEFTTQWIHSKVQLFEDYLEQMDENNKQRCEDLMEFKQNLKILYQPFPQLTSKQPINAKVLPKSQNSDYQMTSSSQFNYHGLNLHQASLNDLYEHFLGREDHMKYFEFMALITLVLALFNSFGRTQFLEIIFSLVFLQLALSSQMNKEYMTYYLIGVSIDFIVDCVWISAYIDNFDVNDYGQGLVEFSVLVSIVMIIVKGLFIIGCLFHRLLNKEFYSK